MRNLHLEASIWYLFSSPKFFEAAAHECEDTLEWFRTLAMSRQVANFGLNNQIYEKFEQWARDFKRGAERARLGDYQSIFQIASGVSGNVRGMMEQPLHSWMTKAEYQEFERVRISRLLTYAGQIESALNNAFAGWEAFFNPHPDYPERSDDDDAFPGDEIVEWYNAYVDYYEKPLFWILPDPLPEYEIDTSVSCMTGDEVPSTGVWYPGTGLENHSLTFAVEGLRMQPAYRVIRTSAELEAEGMLCPVPQTVAVATNWHPLVASGRRIGENFER